MHVLIINGSPRVKKYSNTDKILERFTGGLCEEGSGEGNTFEQYEISDKGQWDTIREEYYRNSNIIIALPLFVECIPGLLMEFLESLKVREDNAAIAYILQSGFAEGVQLRCGETYLEELTKRLGCEYRGTLVKGSNFGIRLTEGKARDKITAPYEEMGREFSKTGNFFSDKCRAFTGPEVFPAFVRFLLGIMFKTAGRKSFDKAAKSWGCTLPLDYRPYD
ncbi:MAG: hypothetical protein K6B28_03090 [Lachnospiraceae bacterium]|nr:hypothetical protein [Lachnospiraceae bacterium]